MQDFFDSADSLASTPLQLASTFESIYGWSPVTDAFLGVNLIWPTFDLPNNYARYFLSWHTEQFDLHWLRRQAQRVYPRSILVANDGHVDTSIFPDNIEFVRWITWGDQLEQLRLKFGVCETPMVPEYKISSLCFRVSQYKNFITAYLLAHANKNQLMLTYHKHLHKAQDLHGYPQGFPWIDELDLELLEPTWLNFKDTFDRNKNTPVANGEWQVPPYQNALVNFTNESFHYSASEIDSQPFVYPAPYLTEKTWKPLLAGRPFLAVGQYNTYHTLQELGLRTDFGFPITFDQDPGDLTRIRDIFVAVNAILATPIIDLYEQSLPSVQHNVQSIKNGTFVQNCRRVNEQVGGRIRDFLSV